MMKRLYTLSIIIFVCMLSLADAVDARTCAEALRLNSTMQIVIKLPIPVVDVMTILKTRRQRRNASRLESATILSADEEDYPERKLTNARKIIDDFYDSLVVQHPDLTMGKDEVIELLNMLNTNGVDNWCRALLKNRLSNVVFPDNKARRYRAYRAKIVEAEKIRNDKNGEGGDDEED